MSGNFTKMPYSSERGNL